jgi:TRAP-type C4-dicarboxylate transport system permease small subunit
VGLARYVLTFRWAHATSELTGYLSAVALVLATASVVHAVASRYLLGRPTLWQTELSIYLLMFVTFVGAAYGLKHHAHVGVDLVVERLPARLQLVVRIITALLSLGVVLVVAWTMTPTWWEAYEEGFRSPTAWRAPLSVVYAIVPLGMLLVACQYVAFIVDGVLSLLGRRQAEVAALLAHESPELATLEEKADDTPGDGSAG